MSQPPHSAETRDARHPIQVVSRRTGISADVLRAWEKRYTAVDPVRSKTGRRLYSDHDIERLTLLRQLTEGGRRIGDVAAMPLDRLSELAREDGLAESGSEAPAAAPLRAPRPHTEEDRPHLALVREALRAGDTAKAESLLGLAASELSTPVFLHEVGAPLLRDVGVRWRSGDTRIEPERVLSLGLRLLFDGRATSRLARPKAPVAVFAPWGGARAELESLLAGTVAGIAGWRALATTPADGVDDLLELATSTRARWVVVTVCGLAGLPERAAQLAELCERLSGEIPLLALGADDPADATIASDAGLRVLPGLGPLVEELGPPGA